ncbi:thiamine diphosphokinase [Paenibacillus macerans]|uniref:Thiamine diphosphokinase n=1 Tax=Paenibacillus macerans TaxID=44252 RepID=A0A090ZDQ9_PAEMA|nr:thiamine diphosphokinase [Paenibacillus macerans]KFN08777.1 thiamine pyrophosphokinase [Paenibacillus macerans]MCY7562149.1 thiamine diphosphokinase [Paenibacillus macerans]MEC0140515.1 thiamine diphosphokinase [Paenibacillus macerans]MEC0153779.1 thiamine diphosphokinase [Paenibacillus macerans]MUG23431.1 thiamine diphosphokinase [Paenibacillus macerans]
MAGKRVLIFAGGRIDPDVLQDIQADDVLIGADRGALFLVEHGIRPHLAVGDFDSVSPEELDNIKQNCMELIACDPVDKDLTDTELAYNLALKQQPAEILMTGVIGTRLDHTLANVHMMLRGLQQQIRTDIWDKHNYITLTGSECRITDRGYTYVSLLPLTPEVTGITLEGFLYPLDNASLRIGQSLGISNRLTGPEGIVRVSSGLLLIMQSKD